jgi:hypothetical protein
MNSMAQQAVPNGIGQSEFLWDHCTSASSFVVRKSDPTVDGTPGAIGGAIRAAGRDIFSSLIQDPRCL